MKQNFLKLSLCALTGILALSCSTNVEPAIEADRQIERKIEETLRKMSLEEKVGQMCQLAIDVLQDRSVRGEFRLSEEALDEVIGKYKVGSILNVPAGIAQDTETWQYVISTIQEKSMDEIGIPCIYGVDQIHGTTYTLGGTLFPQGVNMAATFNRGLMREGSRISAYETRAGSIPWTFAPVLDLGRDPRWPRAWENFGEDPYVNAEMGRESVLGFQGDDPNHVGAVNVAACVKHYMGYGVPVSGKDRTPSSITGSDLREKHFAPFLEAIRNGALSLMVNSASNNGMPFHANVELLTGWLKEDLAWDGLIVTDWADIDNLYTREHIAKDKKEAVKLAINAGIDMSMDPYSTSFCDCLVELVNDGEVPMSRIDDAVRRVLRLKYRLGLFEQPYMDREDYPLFGSGEHAKVALDAAVESLVLLKNRNGILPLAAGTRIMVSGPNANSMRSLNGGWSYTWQGSNAEHCAEQYNTILEALRNEFGASNVMYEPVLLYNEKGSWDEELPMDQAALNRAVSRAASSADVVVLCIGENSYCETPGNLTDLTLSPQQRELVRAFSRAGKPVILVLNEGRPRIVSEIESLADAVVDVMLPGNYGGDALALLLAGKENFSGRLPFSYPKEINSLVTYDYKPSEHIGQAMEGAYNYDSQVNLQWAFGYGLSYSPVTYSNMRVDRAEFGKDDVIVFSVDVRNDGDMAVKESVLLFSSDLVASSVPDNRRLRNFTKLALSPGETKTVSLSVDASDLAFVGYDGKWILEAGEFRFQMGTQVVNAVCTETYKWQTPNI